MPRKETKKAQMPWKAAAVSVGGALAAYFLLQLVNAALLWKETVGEGQAGFLVALAAGISILLSILAFGREARSGRLLFCLLCCGAFLGILVILALGFGNGFSAGNLTGTGAGAVCGALLASLLGGKRKSAKRPSSRRR